MTGIEFHVNTPDKVGYVCRLLRKAVGRGAKLVVTGEPILLRELDTALWTFSALDFVPHCYGEAAGAAVLAASPVFLADSAQSAPHHEVLVNIGAGVPDGFQAFERLIEIVTSDEEDLRQGRRRWKHYADRGYAPVKHDQAATEAS
jgi:DNA polymerase III subunit chi